MEVIVSLILKKWVLGLKTKCFCSLASLGAFNAGVMLVSVGSWGGGAGSVSSCPSLYATSSKFRGVFFPSCDQTSLGKQCFCSAVVLDNFLCMYMVGCTLIFSQTPVLLSQVAHFRIICLLRSSSFTI